MKAQPKNPAADDDNDLVPCEVKLAIAAMDGDFSDEELDKLAEAVLACVAVWNEKDKRNKD